MKESFINATIKFKDVFCGVLSNFEEFFIYISTLLLSILIPYKDEIVFVFMLVVVDWIMAMVINAKKGNLRSARVKNVVGKIIFYSLGYLIAGGLDKFVGIDILGNIVSSALFISETLSILANMMIIWPNIPVLPKIKKYLEKELEKKLGSDDGKDDNQDDESEI